MQRCFPRYRLPSKFAVPSWPFTELSAFATASCAGFGTTSSAACSYRAPRVHPPRALSHHFFVSLRWRTTSRWSSSWRSSSAWREKSSEREVFIGRRSSPTASTTSTADTPFYNWSEQIILGHNLNGSSDNSKCCNTLLTRNQLPKPYLLHSFRCRNEL